MKPVVIEREFSIPTHWGGQEIWVKVQNGQSKLGAMNFQKLPIKASHKDNFWEEKLTEINWNNGD